MRAIRPPRQRLAAVLTLTTIIGVTAFGPAQAAQASPAGPAAPAATHVPINGAGSTYAYPALNQWSTDMESQGLSISYTPNGSAAGRQNYLDDITDFAGSDIAFLVNGDADPFAGVDAPSIDFAYSYIPDVAGGLSFAYNLQVGGKQIQNMRLSGQTLAGIFTGNITNWDDPAITHDYGAQLPSIPITPVTRSDGAGESYFLTNWMLKQYPSLWVPYCKAQGGGSLCDTTPTEFYPARHAGFKALDGATNVAGYVQSPVNNGAIGYVEYAYAIDDKIPVVSMLNKGGFYVQPTPANVAIALGKAKINEDPNSINFLMQDLTNVYTNPDPRTYPLSSYSYLIVPRDKRGNLVPLPLQNDPEKGATISTFVNYVLCQAQQSAGQLGYSPLPEPMVVGGFLQDGHIPGAVASPAAHNYSSCDNPAFHDGKDILTATAPQPNPCQKVTAPLNCTVVDNKPVPTGGGPTRSGTLTGPTGSGPNGTSPGGSSTGPGGTGPGGTRGPGGTGPGGTGGPGATARVDPNTGQVIGGSTTGTTGTTGTGSDVFAQPVGLTSSPTDQWTFGVLTALELLAVVAVPAGLGTWLQRRRRTRSGSGAADPGPSGGVN